MGRAGLLVTGAALALPAVAPRAAFAGASARLVYVRGPGAEQCPGEQAIRASVSTRLGYDPFYAWARDTLFAEIQRDGGNFRTVVKLIDSNNVRQGAREISVPGDDCSAAVDAMGLTISLTIDPSSMVGAPAADPSADVPAAAPERTAPPAPPPAALALPLADRVHTVSPSPSERWSILAGLGLHGSINAAPSPAAGMTLFFAVGQGLWSLDAEGRADLPATGDSQRGPGQVQTWLLVASLVPCIHLGPTFGCGVASAGAIGATSLGIARPIDTYGPWSAAGGRLGAQWTPFGDPLSFRAYGELLATLTRDSLTIDGQIVHTVHDWTADLGVGLAWRFR